MRDTFILSESEKKAICENCAKNLKVMRAYLGWSQNKLATVVGTTRRTICEIESGKRKLSWMTYVALSSVFALNPETRKCPAFKQLFTDEAIRFISTNHHNFGLLFSALEDAEAKFEQK